MLSVENSAALVEGAAQKGGTMRAMVVRGVYIRGTPYPEGAIVEMTRNEFLELRTYNYVVEAPEEKKEKQEEHKKVKHDLAR